MVDRLALPLTVGPTGRLATVVQDSAAEVAQSVALLMATRPGERRSVPDYGLDDPLFSGLAADEVYAAVEVWEDRATPVLVDTITRGVHQHVRLYPATTPTSEDS